MIVKSIQHDLKLPDHSVDDIEVIVDNPLGEGGGIEGVDLVDDQGYPLGEAVPQEGVADVMPAHGANLAEYLDDDQRRELISELKAQLDADKSSRADWERTYTDGLDLLGIKIEDRSFPWPHACGVTHPMILESAVRFQSKASVRLFPAKGPAMVRVFGSQDDDTLNASRRVADDLNFYCLEKMPEYYPDSEQLLFSLAVCGSAFRKVYFDPIKARPCAHFVAAKDFFMPSGFPHLESCPRYTERMRFGSGDVRRFMASGYYRDASFDPSPVELDAAEQKEAELSGHQPASEHNELVTLYEMHTDLDLPGFEDAAPLPYVVTWEEKSLECLGIYRNWLEDDPRQRKTVSYVHYRYVPGLDDYGWGLIHLIGGIAKSSTSILRQLVDAGTLANLSGGLKARSLRIKLDDGPIAPGEWRDVDVAGSAKLADSLFPLPYKEPSQTLLALFGSLVQEGKEFASIADLDISAGASNAPVGTMLALIERAAEVITAVQARLHQSFKGELNLLATIIRRYDSANGYDYPPATGRREDKQADYSRAWSIRPVADPSAATTAQRVMQYQGAMTFSQQAPQLYDLSKLHRDMLSNLGIDNPEDLVPDRQAQPLDPVSENMAIVNGKPVKAFEYQNHEAHIGTHQPFIQDQSLQQMLSQSPTGAAVNAAMAAHIAEHVAFAYRREIEGQLGVPLPPFGEPLPPEVEQQVSQLEAQASAKMAAQHAAEAAAQAAQQQQQDPAFQLEQERVRIEGARVEESKRASQAKEALAAQKITLDAQGKAAAQQTTDAKARADVALDAQELALENEKLKAEVLEMRGKLEIEKQKLELLEKQAQQRLGGAQ